MLPRFEEVARLRPVALLAPGGLVLDRDLAPLTADGVAEVDEPARAVAPYLTVLADLVPDDDRVGSASVGWTGPGLAVAAVLAGDRVRLTVDVSHDADRTWWRDGSTGGARLGATSGRTEHVSRRHGRAVDPDGLAVTLTGDQVTAWVREAGSWVVRARAGLPPGVHLRRDDELAALRVRARGPLTRLRAGTFGQLGLRDLHLATHADGEPVRVDGSLVLSATHAGPGAFATGRTGVWTYAPTTGALTHRADVWFRRPPADDGPPGVYGDHATHLVRDGDEWLVATSTWGDFDGTGVGLVVARTRADLLQGAHVLDATALPVPLEAVGVWDPHLLRHDGEWWLALTAARRFFDFRPGLCRGPDLGSLRLVGLDESRRATEGTVMARLDGQWHVLASDGRDNPRGRRMSYGVYDLGMSRVGALDAPYPTNIPWPNIVRDGEGWLMLTFDGSAYHPGRRGVPTEGSHGDVVVMRTRGSSGELGRGAVSRRRRPPGPGAPGPRTP